MRSSCEQVRRNQIDPDRYNNKGRATKPNHPPTTGRQSKREPHIYSVTIRSRRASSQLTHPNASFDVPSQKMNEKNGHELDQLFHTLRRGSMGPLPGFKIKVSAHYILMRDAEDGVIKEGPKKLLPHLQRIYYSPQHKVSDVPWPPVVALLASLYTLYYAGIPSLFLFT